MSSARYDIAHNKPLRVPHVDAFVTRRLLVNYPVAAERLTPFLPPGGALSLHAGAAWVSACIVEMEHMRPSLLSALPVRAGIKLKYLVYRTRATVPFPDGIERECVLILETNFNRPIIARAASMLSGLKINYKSIHVRERSDRLSARMAGPGGVTEYGARVEKIAPDTMPAGSLFSGVQEADRFLASVAYGAQWDRAAGSLLLVPETHEPWQIEACSCRTGQSSFLRKLCHSMPLADHAMLIRNVNYDYPMFGYAVRDPGTGPASLLYR
ncbi:MAG: DUF2071 domain-containing protein [Chloroflexota bacterium]